MPVSQYPHLKCGLAQDVLILSITEAQLQGDRLVEAVRLEMLAAVDAAKAKKVVVDFGGVRYLSSVGFRPLLALRRKLQEAGGRLVLCCLSSEVGEVFRATRLIGSNKSSSFVFEAQPSVAAAVASLNNGTMPSGPGS